MRLAIPRCVLMMLLAVAAAWDHQLVPFVDHEALSRQKLMVADDPIAHLIARCYRPESTSAAELMQHHGEMIYGEITFTALTTLLSVLGASRQDHFFDLGSGTGKAVLQAALQHRVASSTGVELVHERHAVAQRALRLLHAPQGSTTTAVNVSFHHRSMLETDLSFASIVYVNSLALAAGTLSRLGEKLREVPRGAFVASIKHIPGDHLVRERTMQLQMTFGSGPTEVIIYRRVGRTREGLLARLLADEQAQQRARPG